MQAPPIRSAEHDWTESKLGPQVADFLRTAEGAISRIWRRADLGSILLLLIVTSALRLYLVRHTEVAARDSIGYLRYARQLDTQPWNKVLRHTEQPPLYALAIRAASVPVRQFVAGPESIVMQRSAQLVSALAGILLVLPMYLLGRELFDRRIAFWSVVLFHFLPATGRFLSDGISEATFLLFVATALWVGARSLRTRSPVGFGLAGLCCGLAYLTRIEGGLVAAAIGATLVGTQVVPGHRWPTRRLVICGICLSVAVLAVAGPYMAVIGGITNKQSIHSAIQNRVVEAPKAITAGLPLAVWWQGNIEDNKGWWGLWALGTELSRGVFHIGLPAALIGLWVCRERLRRVPGMWLLLLLCALMAAVLWRLANVMGYLSDRHCLIILFCLMYWIASGFETAGEWLTRVVQPYLGEWTRRKGFWRQVLEERLTSGRALAAMLLLATLGIALPKSVEPLHANRAGLRQAGLWLYEHADASDEVVDPYCWAHYYAGCVFREDTETAAAPGHTPVRYVVLEHGKSEHPRLARLDEAKNLANQGHEVFRWAGKQGKNTADVVVYEVAAASTTPTHH
jgi:hypothetical protein